MSRLPLAAGSLLLLATALVTSSSAPAADPDLPRVQLTYKFKPGQVVHYEVLHDGEITTQFNDVTEVARNSSQTDRHFRVTSVNADGDAELELSIDRVHMKAVFTNGEQQASETIFKSDDSNHHPPQFEQILKSIGKPTAVIRFNPLGRPTRVVSTTRPVAPQKSPAADASAAENYLFPLPENPVAVGDTWKERFEVEVVTQDKLPLKISMLRVYKLAAIEKGHALIDFKTSILTPLEDGSVSAQLIQRETSGRVAFDVEQGLVASRDVRVDRTVVNPFGDRSSMRAASTYKERLKPQATAAAAPPADRK